MEARIVSERIGYKAIATVALAAGEIIQLPDGRAGVIAGALAKAVGQWYEAYVSGIWKIQSASGTTFAVGQAVYWDASASLAITAPGAADDQYLGTADKAKISGETFVDVNLNQIGLGGPQALGRIPFASRIVSLDHADATEHDLIDASQNINGLDVLSFSGIVSEAGAGASEDQLIVTLYDSDDNALSVITFADAGADGIGDILIGTRTIAGGASGSVAAVVPAGKGAYVKVSQATGGAGAAGAIDVEATFIPR